MAKQTTKQEETKANAVVTENNELETANGNPYSTTENVEEPAVIPTVEETKANAVVTENEPIKPTLTDNIIHQDYSMSSTVKVENAQGVTVKLSGTAAKILKNLDANTKIVG